MANPEQSCRGCEFFRREPQVRPRQRTWITTANQAQEAFRVPESRLGHCMARFTTFIGQPLERGLDTTTFSNDECVARDGNQQLSFKPKNNL